MPISRCVSGYDSAAYLGDELDLTAEVDIHKWYRSHSGGVERSIDVDGCINVSLI